MGGGGFVSGIITSKTERNLIYARTDVGGAYRWDSINNAWIPLLDWVSQSETGYLGVESIATDPKNPNKVYMSVGISYFNNGKSAILRSNDYGNTFKITDVTSLFKVHGNGMGRQTGEKLIVDPNADSILYCGSRSNGLFKSVNSGVSWSRISSLDVTTTTNGNGISFVVADPSSGNESTATQIYFVGVTRTGTNFYRTDNAGTSFVAVASAPTTLMPQRAVWAADTSLIITYANGAGPYGTTNEPMNSGQIWKYKISTGTWKNITPSNFSRAFGGISVDPLNPARIIASSVNTYMNQDNAYGDRFFLTTNGGTTWTDIVERGFDINDNGIPWINGHAIHWAGSIEFDPFDTKKAWVTSGNGIFMTENIDSTKNVWTFAVHGLEETVPLDFISIPNGPVASVCFDYDGYRHSDISKYGTIHTPRMGSTQSIAYATLNPGIVARIGSDLYYSTNMGQSWIKSASVKGSQGNIAISSDGSVFLHTPNNSSVTYRSTDRGATWTNVTGLGLNNARPVADAVNANKFYAYSNGNMMISTDGGVSFSIASNSVGSGGSKIIRTVPGREGHIWVALYGGGLKRSTNSGQTFTKINTVTSCDAVGIGREADDASYPTIFIWGTVNGIQGLFRSIDEGASWTRVNDNEHEYGGPGNGQFVVGDMNIFGRVYMSTAGRGVVYWEPTVIDSCANTDLIPYINVNNQVYSQTTAAPVFAGNSLTLMALPLYAGTWSWTGPDGYTSSTQGATLSNVQTSQAGIYSLTYINTCGDTTRHSFEVSVGISGVREVEDNSILIYPNPVNSKLTISGYGNKAMVNVFSYNGQQISDHEITGGKSTLDLSYLQPGTYMISVKNKEIGRVIRLITKS